MSQKSWIRIISSQVTKVRTLGTRYYLSRVNFFRNQVRCWVFRSGIKAGVGELVSRKWEQVHPTDLLLLLALPRPPVRVEEEEVGELDSRHPRWSRRWCWGSSFSALSLRRLGWQHQLCGSLRVSETGAAAVVVAKLPADQLAVEDDLQTCCWQIAYF